MQPPLGPQGYPSLFFTPSPPMHLLVILHLTHKSGNATNELAGMALLD